MKKFKKKYVIAVVTIALVIILPLLFLFGRNDKRESNGILWNGKQTIETDYEQSSIAIPGFTKSHLKRIQPIRKSIYIIQIQILVVWILVS